jgi:hypothetical protein
MQFIQVAYCTTVPLLLVWVWLAGKSSGKIILNGLAVFNFLLIGYSLFLMRQLLGLYQLAQQFQVNDGVRTATLDIPTARVLLIAVLPLFFVYKPLRKSRLLSLLLLILLYWNNPVHSWNNYDLFTKIPVYLSLFSSGYALLWLLKQLPHQSP